MDPIGMIFICMQSCLYRDHPAYALCRICIWQCIKHTSGPVWGKGGGTLTSRASSSCRSSCLAEPDTVVLFFLTLFTSASKKALRNASIPFLQIQKCGYSTTAAQPSRNTPFPLTKHRRPITISVTNRRSTPSDVQLESASGLEATSHFYKLVV